MPRVALKRNRNEIHTRREAATVNGYDSPGREFIIAEEGRRERARARICDLLNRQHSWRIVCLTRGSGAARRARVSRNCCTNCYELSSARRFLFTELRRAAGFTSRNFTASEHFSPFPAKIHFSLEKRERARYFNLRRVNETYLGGGVF